MSFLYSSRPAGNDVIGIDLGTTNSCVSVMEGKVDDQVYTLFINKKHSTVFGPITFFYCCVECQSD